MSDDTKWEYEVCYHCGEARPAGSQCICPEATAEARGALSPQPTPSGRVLERHGHVTLVWDAPAPPGPPTDE